ncbi:MAG: glucosylceramidase [Clostridium sp.]|nr:glucosylceramidase [Clostridium sp.]
MKADVYTTDKNNKLQKTLAYFKYDDKTESNQVKLYPHICFQTVTGFGGAFTEAAGYVYSQMSDEDKNTFLQMYFADNHYNLGRLHMQSCDFALDNYSYDDNPLDSKLNDFSLERDEKYIIPFVQDAIHINPDMHFIASPWSPPAFMKTNNDMNHGGKLKKDFYQMWAEMIAKYVYLYRNHYGIFIDRLTVQNEPNAVQMWDSCIFSAEEEADFACNYLRRALNQAGLDDVKILCYDHNKDKIIDRAEAVFAFGNAVDVIDGIAFHWYSGDHFEALDYFSRMYPEKELFFTEGCVEYSCYKDKSSYENAQRYSHDLIGDFANGTNGMTDWNLLLDEHGGPNHVGNFCESPIMYDTKNKRLIVNDSYYAIAHFSRFVKKGAERILCSAFGAVEAVAFKNTDGSVVCVLMNPSDKNIDYMLRIGDFTTEVTIIANGLQTLVVNHFDDNI